MLGGEVENTTRRSALSVILATALGHLAPNSSASALDGRLRMGSVLGVADLGQRPPGCRLHRLGQSGQDVRHDVHPAALLAGLGPVSPAIHVVDVGQ